MMLHQGSYVLPTNQILDLFENTQTHNTSVTRGHFLNNIYIQDMTE